jgi:hypothetical protein
VYELALFTIGTLSWGLYMPLFAHLGFIVLVNFLLHIQLAQTVGIGTLVVELAVTLLHVILAQLRLVVDAEVLNVLHHFFPGTKLDLLLWSRDSWHEVGIALKSA